MSLLEEIHTRHQTFHRVIAKKARAIATKPEPIAPPPPDSHPLQPPLMPLHPFYRNECMWFYDLVQDLDPTPISIISIRNVTAKYYGLTTNDIICDRRTKDLVLARQVAFYLCKKLTPFSLPAIGRRFGDRDHTTVLYAVRKIERLMHSDEKLSKDIRAITAKFAGVNP
jgi:hypothetical protein